VVECAGDKCQKATTDEVSELLTTLDQLADVVPLRAV
jgi:hypothetical protein